MGISTSNTWFGSSSAPAAATSPRKQKEWVPRVYNLEKANSTGQTGEECGPNGTPFIRVPDLFSSIMASEIVINPLYEKVKPEADARVARVNGKDAKWAAKNAKVDLAFLAASWTAHSDEATLNHAMDWNHWVFLFDDQFDEGHLMTDMAAAESEVDLMLEIIDGSKRTEQSEDPVRYMFTDVCEAVRKNSSPSFQAHWKHMHKLYFEGLLQQVADTRAGRLGTLNVDEYLDIRARIIGVYPAIALTEYAERVEIPEHVLEHPSLQECMRICAELVVLVNDVTSFKKDVANNMDLNIISLVQKNGQNLSVQQAMNEVGAMLDDCYRRWYIALAGLPVWGEKIDREVLRFVTVCRDVALGNLYWSFRTGRYLGGSQGQELRETRRLRLKDLDPGLAALDQECLEIAAIYT